MIADGWMAVGAHAVRPYYFVVPLQPGISSKMLCLPLFFTGLCLDAGILFPQKGPGVRFYLGEPLE